jgi:hypothetical protein
MEQQITLPGLPRFSGGTSPMHRMAPYTQTSSKWVSSLPRVGRVLKICNKPLIGCQSGYQSWSSWLSNEAIPSLYIYIYMTMVIKNSNTRLSIRNHNSPRFWKTIKWLPKTTGVFCQFFNETQAILWSFWNTRNWWFSKSGFYFYFLLTKWK